jgi:hypothetical protein
MILANSGIEKDQEVLDEHHARTDAHQRIYPSLDAMTGDPSRLPEEPGMQSCMNWSVWLSVLSNSITIEPLSLIAAG